MILMDLAQLETLVAVAQEKGFSRAAERLHRTQPAVSQVIRRLEEELGKRVFDRSSHDGTLTDAGRVLYGYALQMLNLREDAAIAVQELGELRRGKVVIAANEYTVVHLLPLLSAYRALHPSIKVEVKRSLASEIPSELLRRDAEIGLLTYRPAQPGLAMFPVARDDLALLVAPGHRLAGRESVSIRELGTESFLAHNVRSPYRERVLQSFERQRTPLTIVIELPSLDAIKRLVEQGLGVALMPRRVAQAEIARGDLVAVTVREMRFERSIYAVYRGAADLSEAARAFLASARQSWKG
ncbi:MAG TPA: LysR family transcriptional regulator [Anaeromyxobacteraceae bacterium]|nr:LysR family transcriptional regulator [Anaeromyxobacteraceae bacterium]